MNAVTRLRLGAGLALVGSLLAASFEVMEPRVTAAAPAEAEVKLDTVKFDVMIKRIAAKQAKLTVVDAWATWCGPCKENFPHLVEMNKKYGGKDVVFASICLDDPTKPKKVTEAADFLQGAHATFTNYLLDETQDDAFERLDISTIPAVFMYGPDGKEIRRFTLEDVNNQFTYDQVETAVKEFVAGKPMTTGVVAKKK